MQTFKENLAKKKTINLKYKRDSNYIYDQKVEGINIRCKCNWYEAGERSSKFFWNLQKNRAIQNQICSLKIGEKKIKNFMKSCFLKIFLGQIKFLHIV